MVPSVHRPHRTVRRGLLAWGVSCTLHATGVAAVAWGALAPQPESIAVMVEEAPVLVDLSAPADAPPPRAGGGELTDASPPKLRARRAPASKRRFSPKPAPAGASAEPAPTEVPAATETPGATETPKAIADHAAPAEPGPAPRSQPADADGAGGPLVLGAGGAVDGLAGFRAAVLRHLLAHNRYPARARERELEGVVRVEFATDAAGRVLRARALPPGTAPALLEDAALAAVAASSPFPAPPPALARRPEIVFQAAIRFALR